MTKEDIKEALEACGAINSPCVNCPYKDVENCYDTLNNDARKLIIAQESEIDRLKAKDEETCLKCIESKHATAEEYAELQEEFANYQLASDKEIRAEVKQSQIDVLNRVMTYINDKIENDYGDMSDSVQYLTINIDDFDDFIDELIKEVQNEQKD